MAPPGRPNMTSVPSISRLLMRAWAPVSFMVTSSIGPPEANMKNPSQSEGRNSARRVRAAVRYITTMRVENRDIKRTLSQHSCHRHSFHEAQLRRRCKANGLPERLGRELASLDDEMEATGAMRSQPRFGVGDERGRDALATVRRGYCKSVHRRAPTVPRGDDGADKRAIVEGDEQRVGRVG